MLSKKSKKLKNDNNLNKRLNVLNIPRENKILNNIITKVLNDFRYKKRINWYLINILRT